MPDWKFIPSEFVQTPGETGERLIWEKVIQALTGTGEGIGILNYTYFNRDQDCRYQPDILLISRDWGLTIIEVKTCRIDNLDSIEANCWRMRDFYKPFLTPFKQGENQFRQLRRQCDREGTIANRIPGRVIVALPCISRSEWQEKGFDVDHPTCPPIIFGDELGRANLLSALEFRPFPLTKYDSESPLDLNDTDWETLQRVLLGTPPKPRSAPHPIKSTQRIESTQCRGEVVAALQSAIAEIDLQQVTIGMEIPPGPQRIRGIAGSGKTLLLCQKAARMHLQHPDWEIALVFFSRSLYQLIPDLLRHYLNHWSNGELQPDFIHGNLKVLHAWGSQDKPGFYSLLRDRHGQTALVTEKPMGSPTERLAAACKRLLETNTIEPTFDAVLFDEGQDLVTGETERFEDKQAIYWLAWQSLRPVDQKNPHLRRLIWTYDEAQSLDSLKIPSYREIFGDELGALLSGQTDGPIYPGGIAKSRVMKRCYRTPGSVMFVAHALGMGVLRRAGMLQGLTTKADWEAIGYEVKKGRFSRQGDQITLHRPPENSPNPVTHLWSGKLLEFEVYSSYDEQIEALIAKIQHNLEVDRLRPSQDILIIVLGSDVEDQTGSSAIASHQLQRRIGNALQTHHLNYYFPGASDRNRYPTSTHQNADQFWWEDAITVSRIHRAKGHEAKMVYIVGLEFVAQAEDDPILRNQLFVGLTRSMAWVHLSGIQEPMTQTDYLFYDEVRQAVNIEDSLTFTYRRAP